MALATNKYQIGNSATALNNFVIETPAVPDGTLTVRRGTISVAGSTVFSIDTNGVFLPVNRMTLATAQNTTSGTLKDFTDIPSWVKRVTFMLNSVSLSGNAFPRLQLGTASGIENTGYLASSGVTNGAAANTITSTAGFDLYVNDAAANASGAIILTHMGSNIWAVSGTLKAFANGSVWVGGSKTLSGTLTQLRLTSSNGTDTFDLGSVNIMYEG